MTFKERIEAIKKDYFKKVYYDTEGKEFDWILNPEYCAEDLMMELNYLESCEIKESTRPTEEALRKAYKKGQDIVTFMKVTHPQEEDKFIKKLLVDLKEK